MYCNFPLRPVRTVELPFMGFQEGIYGTVPPQLAKQPPEALALAVVGLVEAGIPLLAGVVGP